MLSHVICKGIWKIEKSPCHSGKNSLLLITGSGDRPKNDFAPKNKHLLSFFPFF